MFFILHGEVHNDANSYHIYLLQLEPGLYISGKADRGNMV